MTCASGSSSAVRLAAAMPAMRATASTSPFGHVAGAQRRDDVRAAHHPPGAVADADGRLLGGDVDHAGVPGGVEVRELLASWAHPQDGDAVADGDLVDVGGDRRRAPRPGRGARRGASRSRARWRGRRAVRRRPEPHGHELRAAGRGGPAVVGRSRSRVGPLDVGAARASGSSAGRTNISNDANELTGLPGSVKIGVPPGSRPRPCGLPGWTATATNSTPGSSASAALTTSYAPMLTPPEVTIARRRSRRAPAAASRSASGSSAHGTEPQRARRPPRGPRPRAATSSSRGAGRGAAACPGATSSSPVETTATRGRRCTRDGRAADARRARRSCAGSEQRARRRRRGRRARRPRRRGGCARPASGASRTVTVTVPPSVPLDRDDRVRAGGHGRAGHDPGRRAGVDHGLVGRARRRGPRPPAASRAPAATSARRTAYPSIAELSQRGRCSSVRTSCGEDQPVERRRAAPRPRASGAASARAAARCSSRGRTVSCACAPGEDAAVEVASRRSPAPRSTRAAVSDRPPTWHCTTISWSRGRSVERASRRAPSPAGPAPRRGSTPAANSAGSRTSMSRKSSVPASRAARRRDELGGGDDGDVGHGGSPRGGAARVAGGGRPTRGTSDHRPRSASMTSTRPSSGSPVPVTQLDHLGGHDRADLPAQRAEHAGLGAGRDLVVGAAAREQVAQLRRRARPQNTVVCASNRSTEPQTSGRPSRTHASLTR